MMRYNSSSSDSSRDIPSRKIAAIESAISDASGYSRASMGYIEAFSLVSDLPPEARI